jgi:pimeloyl-ACP methyl ester carboxylesterase
MSDLSGEDWRPTLVPPPAEPPPLRPARALTRRVLTSDPGQAYVLYAPVSRKPDAPIVVAIHGGSRNALAHARLLAPWAETYGAVLLAPHFSLARYRDYPRLGRSAGGRRADLALHRIVEEAAALTGGSAGRVHLFGYSAGARFAHRYAMAYPHRVACVVVAHAGAYTFPDPERHFPRGIRSTARFPGLRFEPEAFLRVPIRVLAGAVDEGAGTSGGSRPARAESARRLERAHDWVAAMRAAATARQLEPSVTCEVLADPIRSFRGAVLRGGLGDRAFEAMLGLRGSPPGPA